jgi:uncharacterized membrane-anchored protein YhcB (DUF1043 family)
MSVDQMMALAIVFATLLGPVLAVLVTRYVDNNRQRTARKLEIFRALLRSRRAPLSPEYVSALNMVELEFAGVESVQRAYKNLFDHYQTSSHQKPDWNDRLFRLIARLLNTIAEDLGYDFEQLDVLEGGYLPMAWGKIEEDQNVIREGLAAVARGEKAFPVIVYPVPTATGQTATPALSVVQNDEPKRGSLPQ